MRTTYAGRFIERKCIRARYSPITPNREKLRAGKDGNDRGEERKSRYASFQAITNEDIKEDAKPK